MRLSRHFLPRGLGVAKVPLKFLFFWKRRGGPQNISPVPMQSFQFSVLMFQSWNSSSNENLLNTPMYKNREGLGGAWGSLGIGGKESPDPPFNLASLPPLPPSGDQQPRPGCCPHSPSSHSPLSLWGSGVRCELNLS